VWGADPSKSGEHDRFGDPRRRAGGSVGDQGLACRPVRVAVSASRAAARERVGAAARGGASELRRRAASGGSTRCGEQQAI
jgi:hypothetical protein